MADKPSALDDQSTAYQYIMFSKGAFVFKLLRDTLGEQKFNQLLRSFLEKYRGKNASIYDFEQLATQIAGENMRYFFARAFRRSIWIIKSSAHAAENLSPADNRLTQIFLDKTRAGLQMILYLIFICVNLWLFITLFCPTT